MRAQLPASPFLYVITDSQLAHDRPDNLVARVVGAGVGVVQMREKSASDADLIDYARSARVASAGRSVFIVNDRVDIALLAGADGVHIGDGDISVEDVRRLAGPRLLIGRSTHSVDEVMRRSTEDVDYIAIGPIYASRTKQGRRAVGPDAVAAIKARGVRCPLIAIGGIGAENVAEVVAAGADGIAMISAVMNAFVERSCHEMMTQVALARASRNNAKP